MPASFTELPSVQSPILSPLTTKSSLHEQPLQSSISLLSSLFTLSTLDNSVCTHLLLPQLSLYIYLSTCFSLSRSLSLSLSFSLSLSEPCEQATLSALSIRAYGPRGLERITFLTSLCQMFMTKIDRTTSLTTESNNAFSLNLTAHNRKDSLSPNDLSLFLLFLTSLCSFGIRVAVFITLFGRLNWLAFSSFHFVASPHPPWGCVFPFFLL